MAILTKLNDKGNIRRTSSADMPYNAQFPILNQYTATSTTAQTIINLPFSIDQSVPESLQLYIDGKIMRQGVGNDYVFSAVDVNNTSSQITLNFTLSAGLNIIAIKLGFKKESEFNMDNRFVQLYANQDQAFQAFIDTNTNRLTATTTAGTPAVGRFYSTISGRASLPDLTQDLRVRFGVQRFQVEDIALLPNEFGSSGLPVYSVTNDTFGQVRFVGNWRTTTNSTGGFQVYSGAVGDYVEYTFYGTGLNMEVLYGGGASSPTLQYSVDGGASATISWPTTSSAVLSGRNSQTNQVLQVVAGLPIGVHTVRIIQTATTGAWNWIAYGFEVIMQNATVTNVSVQPGIGYIAGQRITTNSQSLFGFNSMANNYYVVVTSGTPVVGDTYTNNGQTFTAVFYDALFGFLHVTGTGAPSTSGTLVRVTGTGTNIGYSAFAQKGGRALVYQASDGTIARSFQPATYAYTVLSATDHSAEDIARVYDFREFGAGRSDDFSTLGATNSTRAFTLDDGTTTLTLTSGSAGTVGVQTRASVVPAPSNSMSFTFVGTGLDVLNWQDATTPATTSVSIDGGSVGNLPNTVTNTWYIQPVVSGLPYGTHTVTFSRNAAAGGRAYQQFIVYQPKKPTLPSGAIELADYNILCTFQQSNAGFSNVSQGVIKKSATREHVYNGTWSVATLSATNDWNGFGLITSTNGDVAQYTFFGTGFDLRFFGATTNTGSVQMALSFNGGAFTNLTSTNFPTAVFGVQAPAGISFTSATGVLDQSTTAGTQAGCSFACSNLPLGIYTVRMTNSAAATMLINGFDIITPVHSYRSNLPFNQQNGLSVGSQSVSDNRKFTAIKEAFTDQKARSQAFGVSSNPSTTSTTFVPMPDMSCTITTRQGFVRATFIGSMNNSTTGSGGLIGLFVDGIPFSLSVQQGYWQVSGTNNVLICTVCFIVPVSAGTHKFDIYWSAAGGTTANNQGLNRNFIVEEI